MVFWMVSSVFWVVSRLFLVVSRVLLGFLGFQGCCCGVLNGF